MSVFPQFHGKPSPHVCRTSVGRRVVWRYNPVVSSVLLAANYSCLMPTKTMVSVCQTTGHRIVLLGASNLTRGISTVIETAGSILGRPLEVLAAFGHGRSYGMSSSVLGRSLPGIVDCGIWQSLAARPPVSTSALITDIGN